MGKRGKNITPQQKGKILELRHQKLGVRYIASNIGISESAVRKILREEENTGESTQHQAQLYKMVEHIIFWLSGSRSIGPLPPMPPPAGLAFQPVEYDPVYQALKEHCSRSKLWQLWDSYVDFENDCLVFFRNHSITENAKRISLEMRKRLSLPVSLEDEEKVNSIEKRFNEEQNSLRQRHSEIYDCVPETRRKLAIGFKELLLRDKIPGHCRWCRE